MWDSFPVAAGPESTHDFSLLIVIDFLVMFIETVCQNMLKYLCRCT